MRRVLIALVLATLAGCGGDEPEPGAEHASASAAATPAEYPVAWAVDRGDLAKLAEKRLPGAVEGAEVVARTSWGPYLMIVLGEWLHEQGVDLVHPRERSVAATAGDRVVVIPIPG